MLNTPFTVWWLKKDFRLSDNPALRQALGQGRPVLPLFIFEPSALKSDETSAFHAAAWVDGLKHLRAELRKVGGDLCWLRGEVIEVFERLSSVIEIKTVVSHEEVGSDRTYRRDLAVADWCGSNNIVWEECLQTGVFRRLTDRDARSKQWRAWMDEGPLSRPSSEELSRLEVPISVLNLRGESMRRLSLAGLGHKLSDQKQRHRQRVNEKHAQATLADFLTERGIAYSGGISSPNTAFVAGSRLSVHLAWGTITGREVYQTVQARKEELKNSEHPGAGKWRRSLASFLSRLHWRDHFIQRLETEPSMEFYSLNRAYDDLEYSGDPKLLAAWCQGKTGLPLVDACINCARTTGFLNFRMRCMITSVACHAMRLSWKDIMWPMARWWADYEPGIHIAQLQMQAGVIGINTLRTYNPAKQIADHDPKAKFVKRWVPELRGITPAEIIAHQEHPIAEYIKPVVDWKASTTTMRADYYALKREDRTKELAAAVLAKHGSRKSPSSRKRKPKNKK